MNRRPVEVIDLVSSDEEDVAPRVAAFVPTPHSSKKRNLTDNEWIILDERRQHAASEHSISSKRSRIPIAGTCKFEPFGFGEANTEEIMELPKPSDIMVSGIGAAVQAETVPDNDDDELVVLDTGNSTNAMLFPHSREDCNAKPFSRSSNVAGKGHTYVSPAAANAANRQHCDMCYCYVCEIPARKCQEWSRHCDATFKVPMWKAEKVYLSNCVYRAMSPADKGTFQSNYERFLFMNGRYNVIKTSLDAVRSMHYDSSSATICTIVLIVLSMFKNKQAIDGNINNSSLRWVEEAMKILSKAVFDRSCPLDLLRVLTEEENTSLYLEVVPRLLCPFIFKFSFRVMVRRAEIESNTAPDAIYMKEFLSAAAACHWAQTDLSLHPSNRPAVATLDKDTAKLLTECVGLVNTPPLGSVTSAVWLYANAESQIYGLVALLNNPIGKKEVAHLYEAVSCAASAGALYEFAIDVNCVQSEVGLFVLFGVLLHVQRMPLTKSSSSIASIQGKVYVALLKLVFTRIDNCAVWENLSSGSMPQKLDVFFKNRAKMQHSYITWAPLYAECLESDLLDSGNRVAQLVVSLLQFLPAIAALYNYAVSTQNDIDGTELSSAELQRNCICANHVLRRLGSAIKASMQGLNVKSFRVCLVLDFLLTMKLSIIYEPDRSATRGDLHDRPRHFHHLLAGFDNVLIDLFINCMDCLYLDAVPDSVLLSFVRLPQNEWLGDLFLKETALDKTDECAFILRNITNETHFVTFGCAEISVYQIDNLVKINENSIVESSRWARLGYSSANDFFIAACIKVLMQTEFQRVMSFCMPGARAWSKRLFFSDGTPDNGNEDLVEISVCRIENFVSASDYTKYLFIKTGEILSEVVSLDRAKVERAVTLMRSAKLNSYLIDDYRIASGDIPALPTWFYWCHCMESKFSGFQLLPEILKVFTAGKVVKPFLGITGGKEQEFFFHCLQYVRLGDFLPPQKTTESAMIDQDIKTCVNVLQETFSLISSLKQRTSFRKSFGEGLLALCSEKKNFILQLVQNGLDIIQNKQLHSLCVELYVKAAIDMRSVPMMRLALNQLGANMWLKRRSLKTDEDTELFRMALLSNADLGPEATSLRRLLHRLLYNSDFGDHSASAYSSPVEGAILEASSAVLGRKCESSCKWVDVATQLPVFEFINMATVSQISRSEVVMMLVVLGHFEKIRQMFQSWYGMSRETQRDSFIPPPDSKCKRSQVELLSLTELFLQMLLTAVDIKSRLKLLLELNHWLKWHFLCSRAQEYKQPVGCVEAIDLLVCNVYDSLPCWSVAILCNLSFFAEPSAQKLQRLVNILSSNEMPNKIAPVSRLEQNTGISHYRLTPENILSLFSHGPPVEFLNDDVAFTIIHHLIADENSQYCAEICISYFTWRQLEMYIACLKSVFFKMKNQVFDSVARSFCRLVIWGMQWLSLSFAKTLFNYFMSVLLEVLLYPLWTEPRPCHMEFIHITFDIYDSILNMGPSSVRTINFCDIFLVGDSVERPLAAPSVIPLWLRGLTYESLGSDPNRARNVITLRFLCEPTVEGFRDVDFSFLPPMHQKTVMTILPSHLRMSAIAVQHDFKGLWMAFSESSDEIKKNSDGFLTIDVLSALENLKRCVCKNWFRESNEDDGLNNVLVMTFFEHYLMNLFVVLNSVMWEIRGHTSDEIANISQQIRSFFEAIVANANFHCDISCLVNAMVPLIFELDHDSIKKFIDISLRPGCAACGNRRKFIEIFFRLKNSKVMPDLNWKAHVFNAMLGIELALDDLACDIFFSSTSFNCAINPECWAPAFDSLLLVVRRVGFKAVSALAPFVVEQLLLMKDTIEMEKLPLLENLSFLLLMQGMASRCVYFTDIINEYRGMCNVANICRHSVGAQPLPYVKQDGTTLVLPADWLFDVSLVLFINKYNNMVTASDGVRSEKVTMLTSNLLESVLNSSSNAPEGFLTRVEALCKPIHSFAIAVLGAVISGALASKIPTWKIRKDLRDIILESNPQLLVDNVVSMREFWKVAIDSQNEDNRSFVEACFFKSASVIMQNRADRYQKDRFFSMLTMMREDYFVDSSRYDPRWRDFYIELFRRCGSKPAVKKIVLDTLGKY